MSAATLDAPRIASRFAHAGTGSAQAEVLREAFDERDRAAREQARALHVLQQAMQKLQADGNQHVTKTDAAAQARQQEERTDGKFEALRAEMAAGFAKVDNDISLVRKEMEVGFTQARADTALLRKDMEAMQNKLIIKLGGMMVLALGAGAAIMKIFAP